MEQEFLNLYIENLSKRLETLMKNDVLQSTQLEIAGKRINELQAEVTRLNTELEKAGKKTKKEISTDTF